MPGLFAPKPITSNPIPRRIRRGALVAVLLGGSALCGFAAVQTGHAAAEGASGAGAITPVAPTARMADFADLVAQVKPAVVQIAVKLPAEAVADETDQDAPAPGPFGHHGHDHGGVAEARGSGFIVDADGIIVTNNHVVGNATSISVTLDDGTEWPAKMIGHDPRTDVAVIKVDAGKKLPFIQLGNSDEVRPGEWVVAMGNPFGLGGTVTAGIVSARGRDIGAGPYDSFIQVDAPINQGNSGGPLFTQDGKVVGVNTAILSPTGGSVGIGFAIPANTVKAIVADLERDGKVERGYLGVAAQAITGEMSKAMHLTRDGGALIASVEADSPAAKADLKPGDVITAVNGKTVTGPHDLAVDVADVKPGTSAKLDILRDGDKRTVTASVAEMPADKTASNGDDQGKAGHGERHGRVGLALAPLSPEARDHLSLPEGTKGAVVADVRSGSPAEAAGVQAGDVVLGVGTTSVSSPEEAVKAIRSATKEKDGTLALRIMRDGHASFVAIPLDKPSEG